MARQTRAARSAVGDVIGRGVSGAVGRQYQTRWSSSRSPRCGLRTPRELADALAFAAGEAGPPMATAPRTASGAVAPVADRLVFTVEEAAQLLGISRSFAYEAVRRGDIPSIRIGRRILVPKAALHRLLDLSESEDGKN